MEDQRVKASERLRLRRKGEQSISEVEGITWNSELVVLRTHRLRLEREDSHSDLAVGLTSKHTERAASIQKPMYSLLFFDSLESAPSKCHRPS